MISQLMMPLLIPSSYVTAILPAFTTAPGLISMALSAIAAVDATISRAQAIAPARMSGVGSRMSSPV
jgi:hypothetical protein